MDGTYRAYKVHKHDYVPDALPNAPWGKVYVWAFDGLSDELHVVKKEDVVLKAVVCNGLIIGLPTDMLFE